MLLFTFHWKDGFTPFTGVAVKFTVVPEQTLLLSEDMETLIGNGAPGYVLLAPIFVPSVAALRAGEHMLSV